MSHLSTKQIIGRGYESGGLYILNRPVSMSLACSSTLTPFEIHCRLRHPSLSVLKKLYPQFHSLQIFHHLSTVPRVNKWAAFPFELVHSDVWGPYLSVSYSGFKYFVTFIDNYSRTIWLFLI